MNADADADTALLSDPKYVKDLIDHYETSYQTQAAEILRLKHRISWLNQRLVNCQCATRGLATPSTSGPSRASTNEVRNSEQLSNETRFY